jgi:hypothetical protein
MTTRQQLIIIVIGILIVVLALALAMIPGVAEGIF